MISLDLACNVQPKHGSMGVPAGQSKAMHTRQSSRHALLTPLVLQLNHNLCHILAKGLFA